MTTPICDFVRRYTEQHTLRLHMPGHKGIPLLGMEPWDITEINGADSLYEADGIILESEQNASVLFGSHTFYSTEGSSLCIRAMLYLVTAGVEHPTVLAGRNAHKAFLSAAALLDLNITWINPRETESYLSCTVDPNELERLLKQNRYTAVYITSPDYLGNLSDIAALAEVCHRYHTYLLVDNAHGAYLKFLPESRHPIDLGADLCCDSAHKTLPVLTGGAYLHIAKHLPDPFQDKAKQALALFGSTSPSYLILQSLDAVNPYLKQYPEKLANCIDSVNTWKTALQRHGYTLAGNEPLKLTVATKSYGYTGTEFASVLAKNGLICEFADPDFVVMMLSPEQDLRPLTETLRSVPKKEPIEEKPPIFRNAEQACTVRQAMLTKSETVRTENSLGRILATATVGCPPAVPIVVCGETITKEHLACFRYYGIETCEVIKE